jgi:hypothetical protein
MFRSADTGAYPWDMDIRLALLSTAITVAQPVEKEIPPK